jgi:hypothetical protein
MYVSCTKADMCRHLGFTYIWTRTVLTRSYVGKFVVLSGDEIESDWEQKIHKCARQQLPSPTLH